MRGTIEFGAVVPFAGTERPRGVLAVGDPWFVEARAKLARNRSAASGMIVRRYATRYHKVHSYKGRFETFEPGVFANSLLRADTVRLLDMHDESKLLAATNGGGMTIGSDDVGLSFVAEIADSELGQSVYQSIKSGLKLGVSVGYSETEHRELKLAGETVRVITAATLSEISIVKTGAVERAYVEIADSFELPRQHKADADAAGAWSRLRTLNAQLLEAMKK